MSAEHKTQTKTNLPKQSTKASTKLENQAPLVLADLTIRQAVADPRSLPARDVLKLQRSLGNRAIQRLLENKGTTLQPRGVPRQGSEGGFEAGEAVEREISRQQSGGSPLPDGVRRFMEPRFGTDFGDVKVHTDTQSDQLNKSINARAFTTGQHIFFKDGDYAPGSTSGRELLAHELTHVVQQNGVEARPADNSTISETHDSIVQPKMNVFGHNLIRWDGWGDISPDLSPLLKEALANFDEGTRQRILTKLRQWVEDTSGVDQPTGRTFTSWVGAVRAAQEAIEAEGRAPSMPGLTVGSPTPLPPSSLSSRLPVPAHSTAPTSSPSALSSPVDLHHAPRFSETDRGKFFLVNRGDRIVRLKLVGITGERGWFESGRNRLSIHISKTKPLPPEEEAEPPTVGGESPVHSEDSGERELEEYTRQQAAYKGIVTAGLNAALGKLRRAISGLRAAPTDPRAAFIDRLTSLEAYLARQLSAHQEDIGTFICRPGEDGPSKEEVASTLGSIVTLFKPFFACDPSRQGDYLIHEAVHALFRVTDYAYLWQRLFRFLPIEAQINNPDSFVAVARSFAGEDIPTPNSGNERNDRTLGMIQHICFRGFDIMNTCLSQLATAPSEGAAPEPLNTYKQLFPTYDPGQLKAILTLGIQQRRIASLIASNKIELIMTEPFPTTLDGATVEIASDAIRVSYIQPATTAPHVAILAKILMGQGLGKAHALAVAKALDGLSNARHMSSATLQPAPSSLP